MGHTYPDYDAARSTSLPAPAATEARYQDAAGWPTAEATAATSPKQAEDRSSSPPLDEWWSKMTPGTAATALRDGKSLCPDFNRGARATKGPSCVKGLHKCSRSFATADLAECLIMGHTTVEIPDGAPMMMRRHHWGKADATNVVKLVANARRQPGLSH